MTDLVTRVNNATPEELTLMLYEACEANIIQGIAFLKKKNYEQANISLQKAEQIINEFRCTLNFDYEISKSLDSLYSYIYKNLVNGNIKNDVKLIEEVLSIVQELKSTWQQIIK